MTAPLFGARRRSRGRWRSSQSAIGRSAFSRAEIAFEQPPDARDVGEIGGLAVAPPQPRENADDLAVALRRQDRGGAGEGGAVEFRKRREISFGHRGAQLVRHVAAGVFEQRDEIVAGRAADRVLEIEQPAGAHPRPARQQHQIVDMVIAQYQRRRRQRGERQDIAASARGSRRAPPPAMLCRARSARTSPPAAPPRRAACSRHRAAAPAGRVRRRPGAAPPACRSRAHTARARRRRAPAGAYRRRRRNPRSAETRAARSSA